MNPQESERFSQSNRPDPEATSSGASGKPVPPDTTPPAAAELIGDIDAYQKRIEREWETAKTIYQSRISEIMDDFLKKGIEEPAPTIRPAPPPKRAEREPETMENLVARVARELRSIDNGPPPVAPVRPMLPGPKPRFNFIKAGTFAAFLLAFVAVAVAFLRIPEWTPLPYPRTGAIAVADGRMYVADWFRKTLYVHDMRRGAPIISVESLAVGLLAGMQPDADSVWTIDGLTNEIVKHTATPDHQIIQRYPAPDSRPAALVRDGGDLWMAGLDSKMVYRLRADEPTEIRDRYELPIDNVTALQMREKRLWALDGKAREISIFRLQKPLKALAVIDLDPFLRGGTPTGMSLNGRYAWIVTENPSAIVRLPVNRIKKSRSTDF